MPESKLVFLTEDGETFDTREEALQHEQVLKALAYVRYLLEEANGGAVEEEQWDTSDASVSMLVDFLQAFPAEANKLIKDLTQA